MKELLNEIFASIRKNKLRTFLTGFSIAWGIFMLVILLGSGNGLKNGVMSNFGDQMSNTISVRGGWTSKAYGGYDKYRNIALDHNDKRILSTEFPEIYDASERTKYSSSVKKLVYDTQFQSVSVQGLTPNYGKMEGIKVLSGRFINDRDIEQTRKVALIDEPTLKVLFPKGDAIGKIATLDGIDFTIIGIFKNDSWDNTSRVYIPLSTGELIYNQNNTRNSDREYIFAVQGLESKVQMEAFEKRITRRLAAEHHFDPEDDNAIWIWNRLEDYQQAMMIFGGINIFVWIIGLGTLMAGIVGVSNIMLVTVRERTFEFGIRKALGAKPSSIIRLILLESVMITASFGYIGMVLGVGVMEIVNKIVESSAEQAERGMRMFQDPTLDISVAVSATIVLVLSGLIAGYIPARRAARLKTIDALRYNK